jgi:hypothetical protein
MCANSTSHTQAFLSTSDAAVPQEVSDGEISIQTACALNTRYMKHKTWMLKAWILLDV